jgi:hypothetical protein
MYLSKCKEKFIHGALTALYYCELEEQDINAQAVECHYAQLAVARSTTTTTTALL